MSVECVSVLEIPTCNLNMQRLHRHLRELSAISVLFVVHKIAAAFIMLHQQHLVGIRKMPLLRLSTSSPTLYSHKISICYCMHSKACRTYSKFHLEIVFSALEISEGEPKACQIVFCFCNDFKIVSLQLEDGAEKRR